MIFMKEIDFFLNTMPQHGWEVKTSHSLTVDLPEHITKRYKKIPNDFLYFLKKVKTCVSKDEKFWFITLDDYKGIADSAFSWDEIEKMSLIENDDEYNNTIKKFWDLHLPIALSVRNGYEYYAIDLRENIGAIVYGYDPEFEETEKIADTFIQFINILLLH